MDIEIEFLFEAIWWRMTFALLSVHSTKSKYLKDTLYLEIYIRPLLHPFTLTWLINSNRKSKQNAINLTSGPVIFSWGKKEMNIIRFEMCFAQLLGKVSNMIGNWENSCWHSDLKFSTIDDGFAPVIPSNVFILGSDNTFVMFYQIRMLVTWCAFPFHRIPTNGHYWNKFLSL